MVFVPRTQIVRRVPLDTYNASPIALSPLRVAIVHYWFVGRAGGERVVEALADLFPQADLYALVADPTTLSPQLNSHKLTTSFLQSFPGAKKFHRHFLLLQPLALEQFDLSQYDLVLSSESGPAKGVLTPLHTCHVCYCHSPMRYIWDMYPQYKRSMSRVVGGVFSLVAHYMRLWDLASAQRVDHFIANSQFIGSRIRKLYGRTSTVIYPPVDLAPYGQPSSQPGDYYLAAGRLVDYKRIDLAVRACTELNRPLVVVGDGPQFKILKQLAGPTVRFLGYLPDEELHAQLAHCRALLFPGEEDFGIVPVEAQSYGRPVIAYGSGGALETVRGYQAGQPPIDNPTGVFFREQSVEGLCEAILAFEGNERAFSPAAIRDHAQQFGADVFRERMTSFLQSVVAEFRNTQGLR